MIASRHKLVFACGFAVVAGVSAAAWGGRGGIVVAALLAFTAAVVFPHGTLPVVLVLGLVQFGPTKAYPVLPIEFSYVDDIMVLGLFVRWFLETTRERKPVPLGLALPLGLLAVVATVSAFANGRPASQVLLAARGLLLPMALCLVAVRAGSEAASRALLLRIVKIVVVAQAVLAMVQWLARPWHVDGAFGLLGPGGANALGYLFVIVACLEIPTLGRRRVAEWAALTALVAGTVVAAARGAMAVLVPAVAAASRAVRRARMAGAVAILAGVLVASVTAYYAASGRDIGIDLAPSSLIRAQGISEQGGRMLYVALLPAVLNGTPGGWVYGVGPGGFTSYVGMNARTALLVRTAPRSADSQTGLGNADSEWVAVLAEYGIAGVLCVLALMLRPALVTWKRTRTAEGEASDALSNAMPAIVIVTVFAAASLNVLEYQPLSYVFWVLAGLAETVVVADAREGAPQWKA